MARTSAKKASRVIWSCVHCPHAVDGALVKVHIAAKNTAVYNGAQKHTLDALRLKDGTKMGRQGGDVGAVEHTALIEYIRPTGDIGNVAYVLEILNFGIDPLVTPFKCIATAGIIIVVFEDVYTADIKLLANIGKRSLMVSLML